MDMRCLLCAAVSVVLLAGMDAALIAPRDYLLLRLGLGTAGALLLLAGGRLLLKPVDLVLRNLPAGLLSCVVLLGAAAVLIRTAACTLARPMEGLPWGAGLLARTVVLAGTGILLFHVLFYGPLLAAMAYGGGERVVAGKGQILLEVDNSFLDPVYDYYAYRGPIFRGAEPIYGNRHEPLDGEA